MKSIFLFVAIIFLAGCIDYKDDKKCQKYKLYTIDELRDSIEILPPKKIDKKAKIYLYKNILLVNEPNLGIHVIDNSDKTNPINKAFISIMGNIDMAVKDNFLYADSFMDMVVFDIKDLDNIYLVKREKNIFSYDKYQVLEGDDRFRCNLEDINDSFIVGLKK